MFQLWHWNQSIVSSNSFAWQSTYHSIERTYDFLILWFYARNKALFPLFEVGSCTSLSPVHCVTLTVATKLLMDIGLMSNLDTHSILSQDRLSQPYDLSQTSSCIGQGHLDQHQHCCESHGWLWIDSHTLVKICVFYCFSPCRVEKSVTSSGIPWDLSFHQKHSLHQKALTGNV